MSKKDSVENAQRKRTNEKNGKRRESTHHHDPNGLRHISFKAVAKPRKNKAKKKTLQKWER